MSKKYTGHCACGQVTYGFDSEPTFNANCHCTDCKRASGGEMATIALVPDTDFTFFSGTTKSFSNGPNTETCAGKGLDRVFCTNCGSRLVRNNTRTSLASFSCRKALSIASTSGSRRKSRSSRGASRSGHGRSTYHNSTTGLAKQERLTRVGRPAKSMSLKGDNDEKSLDYRGRDWFWT